jgi:hypothetical protein
MRILIVGATGSSHIGSSLLRAGEKLKIEARLCDVNEAWRHGKLLQTLLWRFGGRRPMWLERFSRGLVQTCADFRPDILVSTGIAPVTAQALEVCRGMNVVCANYSTDDPFNRSSRAPWFLAALKKYDVIASPRRANLDDFRKHGCHRVEFLPFGYDPALFFPPGEPVPGEMASDLFFAGTADQGRLPFITAAIKAGLKVRLHGIYWDRHAETQGVALGQADIPTLRRGIQACHVALCVVRHENRDGNSMRTFEIPAVGACMVVEDTVEHREIFGADGECVLYFKTPDEMVQKTKWLLEHPAERNRLKRAVHEHILAGHNTYADRLVSLIDYCQRNSDE